MRIECNITYRCNAVCQHCNKAVGLAKFPKSDMTLEQMKRAVDQLIEQKVYVQRFTFCGGEPILHRELQGMIYEVDRIKTKREWSGWARVLTNAMPVSKAARDKIVLPPRFKWIENPLDDPEDPFSGKNNWRKRPNKRFHSPFWISPADVGKPADFEHCSVRGWCGIGLDSVGWSMCGKAVEFGRLLGIDPTMREGDIFKHVNTPIEKICQHCQYGLVDGLKGEKEIMNRYKKGELPAISPTWERAFAQHAEQPLIELELM